MPEAIAHLISEAQRLKSNGVRVNTIEQGDVTMSDIGNSFEGDIMGDWLSSTGSNAVFDCNY